jgi:HSP20 family molecular chaperone IbpA
MLYKMLNLLFKKNDLKLTYIYNMLYISSKVKKKTKKKKEKFSYVNKKSEFLNFF